MALRKKFPTYRQLDQMDCGPTCIKMLADHFSSGATWTGVRNWMEAQRNGPATLFDLARGLEHHGMTVRWILRTPGALPRKGATLLVVPWPDNHFVIIHKIGRRTIHLIDPAQGRKAISLCAFGKHWAPNGTGIALSVSTKEPVPRLCTTLYLNLIISQHP